jgi:pSer/pThr/pTyr-binding forkhead associated (FHA) protein
VPTSAVRPALSLRATSGADAGRSFDLQRGEQINGREEGSDIQLQDSSVSHNHAVVRVRGARTTIEDLHSTNGTRVNDVRIEGRTPLAPGDHIDLGGVRLEVEQQSPPATEGKA